FRASRERSRCPTRASRHPRSLSLRLSTIPLTSGSAASGSNGSRFSGIPDSDCRAEPHLPLASRTRTRNATLSFPDARTACEHVTPHRQSLLPPAAGTAADSPPPLFVVRVGADDHVHQLLAVRTRHRPDVRGSAVVVPSRHVSRIAAVRAHEPAEQSHFRSPC